MLNRASLTQDEVYRIVKEQVPDLSDSLLAYIQRGMWLRYSQAMPHLKFSKASVFTMDSVNACWDVIQQESKKKLMKAVIDL